jgi:signal transduction histidine kinase
VAEVVADTAEGFRPAAERAGVALAVHADRAPEPAAAADPDRLAQVVANLVENALKYAATSIAVGAAAADGQVQLWVEDDGPGIPADDLPHVFEPFYRANRAATRQVGTGLGLAIVHELVEAMGGEVQAQPAPAGASGTRMLVNLRRWSAGPGG